MKIAMISEHASPLAARDGLGGADGGGQNVFVAGLAAELGRQGHHVTVYTRRDDPALPGRVRLAPGVTVEHVPAGPAAEVPKDGLLGWMTDFARYLESRWSADPPDVAHAHFWMSGLAALQAAGWLTGTRLPVVQTYHALGAVKRRHQRDKDTSPPGRVGHERRIGCCAAAVIATCADETRELEAMGVPRGQITVVPCGVDLDRFTPDGPAERRGAAHRLVALSRLVERKGVDTMIEALADIPGTELVVAGGPAADALDADPEVRRLRRVAAEAGVADRVVFTGRRSRAQVPALLRSADLVVTLPWYEPFGMVPLEAMACGVPVVATGVGGHTDTVVDGETGALVQPRDPAGTAKTVNRLLADDARRARLGAAAARRARARYSWAGVARATTDVYAAAMARGEVRA
ncbi:glycosyltransferase [Actinomadura macrotermitis]|uniref:D-inositol 3-phosphate glycosyltransferase n=1 Tax=Actinomadura macrotermitis TaxID=2585200 RepID=A0A7K0BYR4_9ACTN|nr:glycosyltransferase [Actinomadura macrotermitis]MQY06313.1 D-inositol 3-phosphate glycosyltransferase [Actinomadura macrotermitis]